MKSALVSDMASSLPSFFADGMQLVERGPDDDIPSESGRSRSSAPKVKAAPGKGRSRRGRGVTLSSSFTCWRVTPETCQS